MYMCDVECTCSFLRSGLQIVKSQNICIQDLQAPITDALYKFVGTATYIHAMTWLRPACLAQRITTKIRIGICNNAFHVRNLPSRCFQNTWVMGVCMSVQACAQRAWERTTTCSLCSSRRTHAHAISDFCNTPCSAV